MGRRLLVSLASLILGLAALPESESNSWAGLRPHRSLRLAQADPDGRHRSGRRAAVLEGRESAGMRAHVRSTTPRRKQIRRA